MNIYLLKLLRFCFHCGKKEIRTLVTQYLTSLPDGTIKTDDVKYIVKPLVRI